MIRATYTGTDPKFKGKVAELLLDGANRVRARFLDRSSFDFHPMMKSDFEIKGDVIWLHKIDRLGDLLEAVKSIGVDDKITIEYAGNGRISLEVVPK